jgi:hypothetical protein
MLRLELAPKEPLCDSLSHLGRDRRLVPVVEPQRELPRDQPNVAAVAPVASEPQEVHRRSSGGSGDDAS